MLATVTIESVLSQSARVFADGLWTPIAYPYSATPPYGFFGFTVFLRLCSKKHNGSG